MLILASKKLDGNFQELKKRVFRITSNAFLPKPARSRHALIESLSEKDIDDFGAYLSFSKNIPINRSIILPQDFTYLKDGDIIRIDKEEKSIRTLYRKDSKFNSFLVTEQCNHHCTMCSQPPRVIDDSYIIADLLECIPLIAHETPGIGLTGGEPTLLGDQFLLLLRSLKNNLPNTAIHVLTNGRKFKNISFCASIAEQNHRDLMFGIPIYSTEPEIHNFIVQSRDAWSETIEGIINLKRFGIKVEIRVVLHKDTVDGIENISEFIRRNLPMVDHVAFMGLERMGFGATNWDYLFIDPREYGTYLQEAVENLYKSGIRTSIYNTPLCMIPAALHPFAIKSISDWKNEYPENCSKCRLQSQCGGFFSSTVDYFRNLISPF